MPFALKPQCFSAAAHRPHRPHGPHTITNLRLLQQPMAAQAQGMTASPSPPPLGVTLAKYQHQEDYQAICIMCKDVYGGSDYMPRMLPEYSNRPDVLLLVAKDEEGGNILGVVGGDIRGDIVFLFGLRIAQAARGRGVGQFLLTGLYSDIEDHFRQLGHTVGSIVTVTTTWNEPSQRIIRRLLPGPWLKAEMWPASISLSNYEKTIGWPGQQATADTRILDAIPGARQVLTSDEQAVQLLSRWQVAASCQQVSKALVTIRKRHLHQQKQRFVQAGRSAAWIDAYDAQMPLEWLPSFYELHPADGAWVQEQVAKQQVWVLHARESAQVEPLGVVVLAKSHEGRRWTAGIVADDHSVVHSALLLVDAQQPHWVSFIDRGCLYDTPLQGEQQLKEAAQLHPAPLAVYETTNGAGDMIIYGKAVGSTLPKL